MTTSRKYNEDMTRLMIRRWCDKAERAHADVRKKLADWGVPATERERLVSLLIQENLLNESRYASAFANDRFRFRQWGATKIRHALMRKGVSAPIIADALKRLPAVDQKETARELATKKMKALHRDHPMKQREKLFRYLFAKGFDAELVRAVIAETLKSAPEGEF